MTKILQIDREAAERILTAVEGEGPLDIAFFLASHREQSTRGLIEALERIASLGEVDGAPTSLLCGLPVRLWRNAVYEANQALAKVDPDA